MKSLFSMQVKNNAEAQKLSIALSMVGLQVDIMTAELILITQKKHKEMGGKFDLITASKIRVSHNAKHEKIVTEYEKQKK